MRCYSKLIRRVLGALSLERCCFCRLTGAKRRELDRNVALILVRHPHEVGTHAWMEYIRA